MESPAAALVWMMMMGDVLICVSCFRVCREGAIMARGGDGAPGRARCRDPACMQ